MPFLERLGLHRRELRAWAMYDWANSAFMTTIVGAVFPIYYAQVAAATLDPNTAAFRFGIATTIALALVTVLSPMLGTIADFAPVKKRFLARLRGDRRRRHRRDVPDPARRLGARPHAARARQHRRDGVADLLRLAAAAHRARRRARSRVDGRLRDRLSRRRPAARDQSGVDSVAGDVRAARHECRRAPVIPERGDLVGGVLDSAVPRRAGAARPSRAGDAARPRDWRVVRGARPHASRS